MNEAKIYSKALQDEDYWNALKDAFDYLNTDGKGLVGLKKIIDNIESAKNEVN